MNIIQLFDGFLYVRQRLSLDVFFRFVVNGSFFDKVLFVRDNGSGKKKSFDDVFGMVRLYSFIGLFVKIRKNLVVK